MCVEPSAHPVNRVVDRLEWVGRHRETVLDGDEIEQTTLGDRHHVSPIRRAEQLTRARVRLSPGRWVPTGTVQRYGEMQRSKMRRRGGGHRRILLFENYSGADRKSTTSELQSLMR